MEKCFFLYKCQVLSDLKNSKKKKKCRFRNNISWSSVVISSENVRLFCVWAIKFYMQTLRTSLVAQTVKNLLAIQETLVQFLSQEDLLEKGMATHSSVLACRIPWTEEPGELQPMGLQRTGHHWATNTYTVNSVNTGMLNWTLLSEMWTALFSS